MELLLWRHADAENGIPDMARQLTARGRTQAAAAAQWLSARLRGRYRLLVSPAVRAQQTAAALGALIETDPRIDVGADAIRVLEAAGWGAASETVIVVSHQPTLGQVCALLMQGEESDWAVRKSAIWWFSGGPGAVELKAVYDPDLG